MGRKLSVRYGSMNSSKSAILLTTRFNYLESGKNVLLFTAAIDNRTKVGQVSSRLGISAEAQTFDKDTDFLQLLTASKDVDVVLVDEAQFITERQGFDLHMIAATLGIPVIAYMLRTDFKGIAFPGASVLMSLAEDIQEIKAICACGRKSTMNVRIDANGERVSEGDQILIGGNGSYRQVCATCFYKG